MPWAERHKITSLHAVCVFVVFEIDCACRIHRPGSYARNCHENRLIGRPRYNCEPYMRRVCMEFEVQFNSQLFMHMHTPHRQKNNNNIQFRMKNHDESNQIKWHRNKQKQKLNKNQTNGMGAAHKMRAKKMMYNCNIAQRNICTHTAYADVNCIKAAHQ